MSQTWRTDWVTKKSDTARRLAAGECGGSYGEAMLILCTVLSALAAEIWPGTRIDKRRFVELLKEYSPRDLSATQISIPMLASSLGKKGMSTEEKVIKQKLFNFCDSQVLSGCEVDKFETDILAVCGTINIKDIRDCSYANLLYREVRSGYAHEYKPGQNASSWPMTHDPNARVSYVNWATGPDRRIYFHLPWVAEIALATARSIDALAAIPLAIPATWWIDG